MRPSQRQGFFGGIALLSCATVVLQIVFTRLYSALFGHHLAFLAIALSLLGVGAGGVLLYLAPSLVRPQRLLAGLAYLACIASASMIIAMIVIVQPRWSTAIDELALGRLSVLYLISSLPFLLTGLAMAAAVRHWPHAVSRIYFVDLAGAGLGVLGAVIALRTGAPRTGLIAAVLAAAAALLFYIAARRPAEAQAPDPEPGLASERAPALALARPSGGVVATFTLGAAVLFAGDVGAPWLKLPSLRWLRMDKVELQKWSPTAFVTVDKPQGSVAVMHTDGGSSSPILEAKKVPDASPPDMAYALHKERGPALVIGAGGGVDIRRALKAGQKEIYVTEPNRVVVDDVMRGKYRVFSGELYDRPEVRVAVSDGRSFVRSSPTPFRSIVVSMPDTKAADAVGARSLLQSHLYTVEGVRDLLDRLTPEGTLLLTRWDSEFDRLLSLAAAGLRGAGVASPKDHLFGCAHDRIASLLIKRSPFTKEEVFALRQHCKRARFQETFAPDVQRVELRRRIVTETDPRAAAPGHPTDLSAPTDDRPFFFYTVPARALPQALLSPGTLRRENQGLLALGVLLAASAAALLLAFLLPLAAGRAPVLRARDRGARLRALLFFPSAGAGFLLTGLTLVQHASTLLGPPPIALPASAFVLLTAAGIGSLSTGSIDPLSSAVSAGRRAQILTALLAACAIGSRPLLHAAMPFPLALRLVLALVLLMPVGVLMGSLLPLGVRLIAARAPDLLPWCWGLFGLAGVFAIASGTLLAMCFGWSALLLAGGLAYLIAAASVPPAMDPAELHDPPAPLVTEAPSATPDPSV